MSTLVKALAFGGLAAFAYKSWRKHEDEEDLATMPYIRDAGPVEQKGIENHDWDNVDQQVDESFPASDPPANY